MLFSRKQAQIGVEVAENEVRAARVLKSRHGIQLVDAAVLPVQTTLAAALKQLSMQIAHPRDKSIFAIPQEQVICKTLDLESQLNDRELVAYFKNQAPTWFGLSCDDIDLDYQLLPAAGLNRWQVVASKKIHVQEKITQSHAAGFDLHAIDVSLLALTRIHHYIHPNANDSIAMVMVEPLCLQFCVLTQQQLIYHDKVSLPLVDTPFFLPKLLTTLARQTSAHPTLSCIYLADHTRSLTNFIEKIQTETKITTRIIQLIPDRIQSRMPFDARWLISLSLALWGFAA